MRKLFLILSLLVCAFSAQANFNNVNSVTLYTACSGSSSTCAVTVPSTGAGHLLTLGAASSAYLSTGTVPTGGCSVAWVVPTGTQQIGASVGNVSYAYCLSSTSGTTTINITWSNSSPGTVRITENEYSFTGSSVVLDTGASGGVGVINNTSPSLTQSGVALTLAGANDVIVQQTLAPTAPTSITIYNNFDAIAFYGAADLQNTTNGSAPTWTYGSSVKMIGDAIAFTEITSGGSTFKTQVGGFLVGP